MRRTVTLMTVVVLVGLLAGPVLAGPRGRHGRRSRDHRVTIGLTHHTYRSCMPAYRRYVVPRMPVVVYPTPGYTGYTPYYYPVVVPQPVVIQSPVVYQPVVCQPVPVVPIRWERPRSLFTIILSW